ncbi:hypothetical protein O181_028550 [Austropuccinia psidii MF-1]|uniref:Uncharacterized protein n=1 Tax=Austropuccinia psidii MF-1 TaxID=1389203 RepID=A0A9Q3CSX1_9BASI|nr:hypothetical protein [Austropuccinia psidii MF-1]
MVITKQWNTNRQFKLLEERETRIRENQATIQAIEEQLNHTDSTLIPSGSQGVGQLNSPVASPNSVTSRSVANSHHYAQSQVERIRPNDPEYIRICERSTQEPEIGVNSSRMSSPTNRNIPPTKNEHNVVTPESNLNNDQLWLQISQFSAQTQEKFNEHHRSNERLKELKSLHEAAIKDTQESCAKLHKASEETNKRLNQVFEEK